MMFAKVINNANRPGPLTNRGKLRWTRLGGLAEKITK